MIDFYLNSTASHYTHTEGQRGPSFALSGTINIRVEEARGMTRLSDGREAVSNILVITDTAISEGDRLVIDGANANVLTVTTVRSLDGSKVWYEARL